MMNLVCYYNSKGRFDYYNIQERKELLQYKIDNYKRQLKKYKNKEECNESLNLKNKILLLEFKIQNIEKPDEEFKL